MNKFCFKACFCKTLQRPKGNSHVYFRKQVKFIFFFKKRVNKLNTWKDKALKKKSGIAFHVFIYMPEIHSTKI